MIHTLKSTLFPHAKLKPGVVVCKTMKDQSAECCLLNQSPKKFHQVYSLHKVHIFAGSVKSAAHRRDESASLMKTFR